MMRFLKNVESWIEVHFSLENISKRHEGARESEGVIPTIFNLRTR
jgi:hypothetical protein